MQALLSGAIGALLIAVVAALILGGVQKTSDVNYATQNARTGAAGEPAKN